MKGVLVIELDLDKDINVASAQLSTAVRAVRGVRTEQMTDEIVVGLDYAATKVLKYLKSEETQSASQ